MNNCDFCKETGTIRCFDSFTEESDLLIINLDIENSKIIIIKECCENEEFKKEMDIFNCPMCGKRLNKRSASRPMLVPAT